MSIRLDGLLNETASVVARDFPIRVLIISEVRFLRESLAEFLARDNSISISGLIGAPEEFLPGVHANSTDIVLLDEAFSNGPIMTGWIRSIAPQILVVVIAVAETAEEIITWAEAGVAGYVPRTASLADIAPLLVEIRLGKQPCLASVAAGLLRRLYNVGGAKISDRVALPKLTAREAQIAQLIAEGMSNKDIARHLDIGVATAKTHVHNLLRKLNLRRRGQTAIWMQEHRDGLSLIRKIRPRARPEGEKRFAEQTMLKQKDRAGA